MIDHMNLHHSRPAEVPAADHRAIAQIALVFGLSDLGALAVLDAIARERFGRPIAVLPSRELRILADTVDGVATAALGRHGAHS